MPRRRTDVSRAVTRCRVCGKPLLDNEPRYTIADRWDDDAPEDVDVLLEFEHWKCHTPMEKALADLRQRLRETENLAAELRKRGL
jgi:hypothetical protein